MDIAPRTSLAGVIKMSNSNRNGQKVICKTNIPSPNHRYANVWIIECGDCSGNYLINSCDFHDRNCPKCIQNAQPGFRVV